MPEPAPPTTPIPSRLVCENCGNDGRLHRLLLTAQVEQTRRLMPEKSALLGRRVWSEPSTGNSGDVYTVVCEGCTNEWDYNPADHDDRFRN